MTSVTLGNSVTTIGNSAFDNCTSLRSVSIPNSVTSIGDFAFEECVNLRSIKIPDSVTSIGSSAFSHCTSLESANIPDSVKTIKQDTFAKCESLESIIIPSSVTSIDRYAFANCLSLTSITIPESVKSIDEAAFSNCTHLTSVTILNSSCEIFDDSLTICSGENYEEYKFIPFYNGTIFGYEGSTAQAYAEKYGYKFEAITGEKHDKKGDANCDGQVNIADAVLVMQVATNPDKYAQGKSEFSITAQGEINADVDGKSRLTNEDALLIQQFKLGLIDKF